MYRSMVYEWLPPAEPLCDDDRAKAVAYLAKQARFDLAVWVGYRFRPEGQADHELKLRLRGRRPCGAGLRALFWGVTYGLPTHCYVGFPTRAEMQEVERVGELIWERRRPPSGGADPLEFRFVYEPVEVPRHLRASIREAIERFRVVRRVRITRSTLLKSDRLFRESIGASVECDGPTAGLGKGPVGALSDLLRGEFAQLGVSMGSFPRDVRATTVYVRRAAGGTRGQRSDRSR